MFTVLPQASHPSTQIHTMKTRGKLAMKATGQARLEGEESDEIGTVGPSTHSEVTCLEPFADTLKLKVVRGRDWRSGGSWVGVESVGGVKGRVSWSGFRAWAETHGYKVPLAIICSKCTIDSFRTKVTKSGCAPQHLHTTYLCI